MGLDDTRTGFARAGRHSRLAVSGILRIERDAGLFNLNQRPAFGAADDLACPFGGDLNDATVGANNLDRHPLWPINEQGKPDILPQPVNKAKTVVPSERQ